MNVCLAILLTCFQEEKVCLLTSDRNWALVLSPWLKSSEQETRLSAFITACCLSHHLYDKNLQLNCEDQQELLVRLAKVVELPFLKVAMLNNMVSISATQFIMSLTMLMLNLKIVFKPKEVFKEVVNLFINGGLPEIKVACSYICALRQVENNPSFELMVQNCELPLVEIIENFQEIEDADVKKLSAEAALVIQSPTTKGIYLKTAQ